MTPMAGEPLGSPGMLYSAFHGEPDGSADSVGGRDALVDPLGLVRQALVEHLVADLVLGVLIDQAG